LLELTPERFELRTNKGYIDEALKAKLEMPLANILHAERTLVHRLEQLGYRCRPLAFSLARREYLLAGISDTETGDAQYVDLSRTARDIVARYVYGDQVPEWMGRRREAFE